MKGAALREQFPYFGKISYNKPMLNHHDPKDRDLL
jgi:hypothetical protein